MKKIFLKKDKIKYLKTTIFIISFFFIAKLFFLSSEFVPSSWGFIDLDFEFRYYWISSSYIALVLFLFFLCLVLFSIRSRKKNNLMIFGLLTILLIVSILWKPIFYSISPKYKFYLTETRHNYPDEDGKFDIDNYISHVDKYCNKGKTFLFGKWSWGLCLFWGKLIIENYIPKTEELIKLFDYANGINAKNLYWHYVELAKKRWIEEVLEKYRDKDLQVFLINKRMSNRDLFLLMRKYSYNEEIRNNIDFLISKNQYYDNNLNLDVKIKWYEFWEGVRKEFEYNLKQMTWINKELFF